MDIIKYYRLRRTDRNHLYLNQSGQSLVYRPGAGIFSDDVCRVYLDFGNLERELCSEAELMRFNGVRDTFDVIGDDNN